MSTSALARQRLAVPAGVRSLHEVLDTVDASAPVPAGALAGLLREVDRLVNRVAALRLDVLAAADRARVAAPLGLSGTGAWVQVYSRVDGAKASGQVDLARAVADELPGTRSALASGALSAEHASVICGAMRGLPSHLGEAERVRVEDSLVREAGRVDPARLRKAARRALAAVEPDPTVVDAAQDAALRTEEDRAWASARLTLHDHGNGTTSGTFVVPTPAAAVLRKVVQQLAAPSRHRAAGAGRPSEQAAGSGRHGEGRTSGSRSRVDGSGAAGTTSSESRLGRGRGGSGPAPRGAVGPRTPDWSQVDWAHEHGRAFAELLERLSTDRLAGKVAATVVVTVAEESLRSGVGAARLDTGQEISVAALRRLACEAGILPVVLGGESQILDLGRTRRFFNEPQRIALGTRYSECAVDGCDRPYAWCHLHHAVPWGQGGPTDLDVAIPVCGWHHRRVHDPRYVHEIRFDAQRRAVVTLRLRT